MIDVGPIRAFAAAVPFDLVGMKKAQLEQLLAEVERGQAAIRELAGRGRRRKPRAPGTGGVSAEGRGG